MVLEAGVRGGPTSHRASFHFSFNKQVRSNSSKRAKKKSDVNLTLLLKDTKLRFRFWNQSHAQLNYGNSRKSKTAPCLTSTTMCVNTHTPTHTISAPTTDYKPHLCVCVFTLTVCQMCGFVLVLYGNSPDWTEHGCISTTLRLPWVAMLWRIMGNVVSMLTTQSSSSLKGIHVFFTVFF